MYRQWQTAQEKPDSISKELIMEEKKERPARRERAKRQEDDGLIKKLIQVNRVTKTVKGGRNMRFAALVASATATVR